MLADRCSGLAQPREIFGLRRVGVVVGHVEHPHALLRPFPRQALGHLRLGLQAAPVIGDETDGLEPAGLEAAGDALQHPGIDVFGYAHGAGETQVSGRGS